MQDMIYTEKGYEGLKEDIRAELQKSAEGFVRIGYLLKVARDTDVLSTSQYSNYLEFAAGEFGLEKTTVSRFIAINDRFSVDGNSMQMLPQYAEFGRSQLQEMLLIPEHITEELSPDMTRQELTEIKKEIQEEEKITDIEVMLEPKQEVDKSVLQRTVDSWLKESPQLYMELHKVASGAAGMDEYKEIVCPNDDDVHFTRPAGMGRVVIHCTSDEVSLTNVRSGAKEAHTWQELTEAIFTTMHVAIKAKDSYAAYFGEEIEEEEVAPVQQPKKESKVHTPEKKVKKAEENHKNVNKIAENVTKTEENVQKEPESVQKEPESVQQSTDNVPQEEETGQQEEVMEPQETEEALGQQAFTGMNEPQEEMQVFEGEVVEEIHEDICPAGREERIPMPDDDKMLLDRAYEACQSVSNAIYQRIEIEKNHWSDFEERKRLRNETIKSSFEALGAYINEMERRGL